mgnify:CR=1 FL=1
MADLIPFQFHTTVVSTITDERGNPWFVAADVCAALEIKNVSDGLSRLDADEKSDIVLTDIAGRPNKMLIVSEHGLYRLALSSRKKVAREFQRWVTHDVLPALRKTGTYAVAPSPLDKYPELRAIQNLVLEVAETRERAAAAEQRAIQAETTAARAEGKADIALSESHRMTVEHFIMANGLLHQFPPADHARLARWLVTWCLEFGQEVRAEPVIDKDWPTENCYPLCAFSAMLRHEKLRGRQLTMVARPQREESTP